MISLAQAVCAKMGGGMPLFSPPQLKAAERDIFDKRRRMEEGRSYLPLSLALCRNPYWLPLTVLRALKLQKFQCHMHLFKAFVPI